MMPDTKQSCRQLYYVLDHFKLMFVSFFPLAEMKLT